jgi:hypothetical protein
LRGGEADVSRRHHSEDTRVGKICRRGEACVTVESAGILRAAPEGSGCALHRASILWFRACGLMARRIRGNVPGCPELSCDRYS